MAKKLGGVAGYYKFTTELYIQVPSVLGDDFMVRKFHL